MHGFIISRVFQAIITPLILSLAVFVSVNLTRGRKGVTPEVFPRRVPVRPCEIHSLVLCIT